MIRLDEGGAPQPV